jgi:hypothetical protein
MPCLPDTALAHILAAIRDEPEYGDLPLMAICAQCGEVCGVVTRSDSDGKDTWNVSVSDCCEAEFRTEEGAMPTCFDTDATDIMTWIRGHDIGISSETIWEYMTGLPLYTLHGRSVPLDPDDFGRCYRLLKLAPAWVERLPELAARYPEWGPMVREWARMTALYEEEAPSGRCPKLYALMDELLKEAGRR